MTEKAKIEEFDFVSQQYKSASNLNARIRMHQECSTNPYGWQRWLFDRLHLAPGCRVLELGCGAGNLWLDNLVRIPTGLEIHLSDFSEGMLAQARANLEGRCPCVEFRAIDAQSIPYPDQSFEMVIANHMLYHVPDRGKALAEIRRVLKTGGRLYASTVGEKHLNEMDDLIRQFDPALLAWGQQVTDAFSLENGAGQLRPFFEHVSLERYPDSLLVKDAQLLADYILSGQTDVPAGKHTELLHFVEQVLAAHAGTFTITKDSGLFEAN
jgi:ubiquinone/menaquinone biosynthesis C-methylase UbiE